MRMYKMNINSKEIINALGGTSKVAKIFNITMPSVTGWKSKGIPLARLMYLEVKYPHLFPKKSKRKE